jgi:hypothetical protein
MIKIIDTNNDTTNKLQQLKGAGIECIIRYISTATEREKCVKPTEAKAIAQAGLKLGLVLEVWGGSDNFSHDDINASTGASHGAFARNWAEHVGAPDGTIIWFAIDNDVSRDQFARFVQPYFQEVRKALAAKFRTGIYSCGYACQQCLDLGIVDASWLSNAMGWNGSREFRTSNRWRLLQAAETSLFGLSVDPNQANGEDYGAFVPWEKAPAEIAVAKETPMAEAKVEPGKQPAPQVDAATLRQLQLDVSQLAAALRDFRTQQSVAPQTGGNLSPIDKALGGQAMVGLKTPLAILAYAGLWIMQAFGAVGPATGTGATPTAQVLTALIAAFGGLGVTAKLDRLVNAANATANAAQKTAAQTDPFT